jgi:hypothetical protein
VNREFYCGWCRRVMAVSIVVAATTAFAQDAPSTASPLPFPAETQQQLPATSAQPDTAHHPRVFSSTDAAPATSVTPSVQVITGATPAGNVATQKRKSSYEVTVGTTDWIDTGIPLNAGDTLHESATGTLTFADGHTAQADGGKALWRDLLREYPLPTAPAGALIGRVGSSEASVPFLLGANGKATAATSGDLFLRANVSKDLGADGEYKVKITFLKPEASSGSSRSAAASEPVAALQTTITPALFANIPRRVQDEKGSPGDMVNFAVIGTPEALKRAFTAAGWVPVDKSVEDAVVHGLEATLEHKAYVELPMSTLYLFGRPQDFSYSRAAPLEVAAVRHHLRVWDSGQKINGRTLWVGGATHDNGFEKDERNGNVTHHIDPNVDEERDFLLASFQQAGTTSVAAYVLPANPVQSARTATGGSFHTDGRIVVMELK